MAFFRRIHKLKNKVFNKPRIKAFLGSKEYWEKRYEAGGISGEGSYNHLAEFKADVINSFIKDNSIKTVIEFGFGDGNQLSLLKIPSYLGFDVSPTAVNICRSKFINDSTKKFKLMSEYHGEKAEITLSLDVIFHLIEEKVYKQYMERLFNAATKFVIIYSSNKKQKGEQKVSHFKERKFTDWTDRNCPEWKLIKVIPNKYSKPINGLASSVSDFYIFENKKHRMRPIVNRDYI